VDVKKSQNIEDKIYDILKLAQKDPTRFQEELLDKPNPPIVKGAQNSREERDK